MKTINPFQFNSIQGLSERQKITKNNEKHDKLGALNIGKSIHSFHLVKSDLIMITIKKMLKMVICIVHRL